MNLTPAARQGTAPYVVVLLAAAAAAWAWVLARPRDMGVMPGAAGLGPAAFLGAWTVMMAAMMLPATAVVATLYARTLTTQRLARLTLFAAGYLVVWALAGVPAYLLALGAGRVATGRPVLGTAVAAGAFALTGAYQLSPWKERCLRTCRAPFSLLLRYASWRGPSRELRAGAHHGAFCLGCCWSLMVLLGVFGMMNVWAMAGLAAVVLLEKATPAGPRLARVVGAVSLVLAVTVVFVPQLAPGLTGGLTGGPAPMAQAASKERLASPSA
ncbi:MAG TPA: DUF2182 domain-containing protein [Segeticoccus sp.]|uniref:DUF2182 domain-containing protein n=1 Tax=Segeticoccus sp. TaxID=2706531 RepID=UPI002D804C50|nr:DUF2182 domain-containing protein [Segeticoccus sp.]HET8599775.1 DUF2182 domain-containing protein [Segeticoccus sp.]